VERVRDATSVSNSTCVACTAPLSSDHRCGHCGAAQRAGPYRVLRVLSRSQHGAMYLAEDEAGAKVALKELVFSLVPSAQELDAFHREAALLKALSHPRIPKFLASFTEGSGVSTRLYLAQQFLSGRSLTAQLETEHFDEASVLTLARQALEVLSYLHGRSPVVVHRDVKPDNFILAADGKLSLVDFGAARSVNAAGTHRATLVGTFGYMAPEQLGGTVDARSDLYGLGATLVHLLTRTPPERLLGPGMSLDFQKHVNVSVKTERFLSRLVATRPNQRFASAQDALAFLEGRSLAQPRSTAPGLTFAAISVALFAGALVTVVARRELPAELPARVVEPAPRVQPVMDPVLLPATAPPAGEVRFPWEQGKWDFGKPGHWVIDESGRGHHALLPTSGFTNSFFGLVWDGTTGLSTPDSRDFALTGPFTIEANFHLEEEPLERPVTLISRGDLDGKFAWGVQIVQVGAGRVVRFVIADQDGKAASIAGELPPQKEKDQSGRTLYVSFDPKTGEQRIELDCAVLASGKTQVRPALELPREARLQLITGLRGSVSRIELMRGLMQASGPAPCSYSGVRLEED